MDPMNLMNLMNPEIDRSRTLGGSMSVEAAGRWVQ